MNILRLACAALVLAAPPAMAQAQGKSRAAVDKARLASKKTARAREGKLPQKAYAKRSAASAAKAAKAGASKKSFRGLAENAVICEEHGGGAPHIPGYITLELACNNESRFCFSLIEYLRDFCEGRNLMRRSCESGGRHALKTIFCPAGCAYKGHIGHCL